jgi:hypothetical protein
MAEGFKKVTLTNIDVGPRGIYTQNGLVILNPRETREDLSIHENELGKNLPGYFHEGKPPSFTATAQPAAPSDPLDGLDAAGLEALAARAKDAAEAAKKAAAEQEEAAKKAAASADKK